MKRFVFLAALLLAACGDSGAGGSSHNNGANGNNNAGNAEPNNIVAGDAIVAENETWTWVEFPNSACANGQAAGLGVNLTDRSDDLLVYFQGGGACWDVNTCFVLNSAVNVESGYDAQRLDNEPALNFSAFDRDDIDNPFRDLNWVFVPYCTGDLHAGDKVKTYEALGQTRQLHHVGGANVERFLSRLVPTFTDAQRVFVSGSSAGGYGAQLNFHRFHQAFAAASVHALSDSAPMVQPYGGRYAEWHAAWELQAPAECQDCTGPGGLPRWLDHLTSTYPDSRFGLLAYDADQVIHLFFNYPFGDSYKNASDALVAERYAASPNAQAFVLSGTEHVMLGGLDRIESRDGTALNAWVEGWLEGDPDWQTVAP